MSKIIHRANSRGTSSHTWLLSHHTFSFADYYHPNRMGFGSLRVLNDDVVDPAKGFGTHAHQNMEIISIPLKGSLRHEDSEGNRHTITSGEIQLMSAGSGIYHSEFNNSDSDVVNFLQIWIQPKEKDLKPSYDQKRFDPLERVNQCQLIVSPHSIQDQAIKINQNAYISLANIQENKSISYHLHDTNNGVYFFILNGTIQIDNECLSSRDGMACSGYKKIDIIATDDSEILIIEVPI